MPQVVFILAQGAQVAEPHALSPRQKLVAITLILTVVIIALCVLALLVFIRVRARDMSRRSGTKASADAWAESGKRLVVEETKDTGDTVDIDPSELSRGDIEPESDGDENDRRKENNGESGQGPSGENGHGKPPSKGPHG